MGNNVVNVGLGICIQSEPDGTGGDTSDLVVSNNYIANSAAQGIYHVKNLTGKLHNAIIANNVIKGCQDIGIELRASEKVQILGNQIDNTVNEAISTLDNTDSVVYNKLITTIATAGNNSIIDLSRATNCLVEGNSCDTNVTQPLKIIGPTNLSYGDNNVFKGFVLGTDDFYFSPTGGTNGFRAVFRGQKTMVATGTNSINIKGAAINGNFILIPANKEAAQLQGSPKYMYVSLMKTFVAGGCQVQFKCADGTVPAGTEIFNWIYDATNV